MKIKKPETEIFFYNVLLDKSPLAPYSLDAIGYAKSVKKYREGDRVTIFNVNMKSLENGEIHIAWDNEKHKENEHLEAAKINPALIVEKMTIQEKKWFKKEMRIITELFDEKLPSGVKPESKLLSAWWGIPAQVTE